MSKTVTVNLMGGLGNQMFQYAAGRALAARNSADLYVDAFSGFVRDAVYKRTFELGEMAIEAQQAGWLRRLPFWASRFRDKARGSASVEIESNFWGTYVRETVAEYRRNVAELRGFSHAWLYGYWQCERYFEDVAPLLARELMPPTPADARFIATAERMASCNSVAVGVRLFEEVPGATKAGVGGLTPIEFYNSAIQRLLSRVNDPVFFVFCTTESPVLKQIEFPGPVHFITHDNGFHGSLARLWLISRCTHHILSNSSFYWWAAWLAEKRNPECSIIASAMFPNRDTIPARWTSL